jgi:hypothetical protein
MVNLITSDNLVFTKSKCNCGISVNQKIKKSKSLNKTRKNKTKKNKTKTQN